MVAARFIGGSGGGHVAQVLVVRDQIRADNYGPALHDLHARHPRSGWARGANVGGQEGVRPCPVKELLA